METPTATPAKLRSGNWGARVPGRAVEGQTITIRTQSGKSWDARVTRVVWANDEASIVETLSLDDRRHRSRRGRCRICGGDSPQTTIGRGICDDCV